MFPFVCLAGVLQRASLAAVMRLSLSVADSVLIADTVDHQGRALLQNNQCPRGVGNTCPSGAYWYCQQGKANGGCRPKSQKKFPDVDCRRQCLTS